MWIERNLRSATVRSSVVTPLAGVWIERYFCADTLTLVTPSLPLRECGLKDRELVQLPKYASVTPLAGVWIESALLLDVIGISMVTPLAGVWIESQSACVKCCAGMSLPLRECGLKAFVHFPLPP